MRKTRWDIHIMIWITLNAVLILRRSIEQEDKKKWWLLRHFDWENIPFFVSIFQISHHDSTKEANAPATICIGHNVTVSYAQKGDGN